MPYLPSAILVVAATVLLVFLLVGSMKSIRRFALVTKLVSGHTANETGLLKARSAALNVAVAQRRSVRRARTIEGLDTQEDNHA